ncbi:efflux RND transporter periplasmic adaptor subunit [Ancylobacter sp. WKF20]|uniref:efflux RND transporter periplasmic adaptor subunit n=1 Tax=Ancylobacter sp. WKF20 TaxID=3039801 RepID=UPI00243453D6|nr:efflux RND transporter periplasmic adaptor subunit [Ancylobacter sp. WKF20]WGD31106.1 efflux RND transporter periplasmic adaptor subunit [Ancylobacter sp. WKF20]
MSETAERTSAWRGRAIFMAGLLLAVGGGLYVWSGRASTPRAAEEPAPRAAVPVNVATVERRSLAVVLNGIGMVQASRTVNIHARIDGTLQSVNFREGQNVKAGDVLAQLDPKLAQANLDQVRAGKVKDEAQLRGAEADLARYAALVQKDYASRQTFDQQQATVDELKAAVAADAAAVETAQTNLDYTTVTAPVDGRMGIRQVDAGNLVHTSDSTPIAVLATLTPIDVVFSLPEKDIAAVQEAQARGPVLAVATRDDGTVLGTGTLTVIDNQIDATTATLKLKASFPNDDERLWPGAFVHVALTVGTMKDAVTVPVAAIQRGPDGVFAWVVTAENTAVARPIVTGHVADGFAVVKEGLTDGDRVVVNGQYRLRANTKVAVAGGDRESLAQDTPAAGK